MNSEQKTHNDENIADNSHRKKKKKEMSVTESIHLQENGGSFISLYIFLNVVSFYYSRQRCKFTFSEQEIISLHSYYYDVTYSLNSVVKLE